MLPPFISHVGCRRLGSSRSSRSRPTRCSSSSSSDRTCPLVVFPWSRPSHVSTVRDRPKVQSQALPTHHPRHRIDTPPRARASINMLHMTAMSLFLKIRPLAVPWLAWLALGSCRGCVAGFQHFVMFGEREELSLCRISVRLASC